MGVFTEQVQGLVSEERTKRQERQRKEQEKLFLQELEERLYYVFIDAFTENKNVEKTYIFLTTYRNKCEILRGITRGLSEKKQDYYYYILDLKYNNILNKAKQGFFPEYKQQQKEKIKQEKEEEKEPTTIEVIMSIVKCILLILFLPILFFIMLFYYLLK